MLIEEQQEEIIPVYRPFRYSAGFYTDWVRWLVRERGDESSSFIVFDSFSGVGTTLLVCDVENIQSWGFENLSRYQVSFGGIVNQCPVDLCVTILRGCSYLAVGLYVPFSRET